MNELIREADKVIICPRANTSVDAITIDLKKILEAEARMIEVQAVTPSKAGELCTAFTISWRDLHRNICQLETERVEAQKIVDRRRAVVFLEVVPEYLKKNGLYSAKSPTGNEEIRNAILNLDTDFQAAQDVVDQITAVIELLKGKLKAFEMSFTTVKKIMGSSDAYNYLGRNDDKTRHSLDEESPAQPDTARSRMGSPRY
jgi:hypothetical protein